MTAIRFENQEYFEDFIARSTYHSNGIEGNTLSYAETYAILFNDNEFDVSAKPREIYEAINHKYAINYVINHLEEDLSERMIKDIAIHINRNISDISGYRKVQVMIKGAEHIPPAPGQVPQSMMYFVYNYNNTMFQDVFQKIAEMHIQFERIHPFEDGNGRTGRLLLNYELLKNGCPPIVIPKEERTKYFKMLSEGDSLGMAAYFKYLSQKEEERIHTFQPKESLLKKLDEAKAQAKKNKDTMSSMLNKNDIER